MPPVLVHPQQERDLVPEEQVPGQIWSRTECFPQVVSHALNSCSLCLVAGVRADA
jgi:hypothetical protein